jgi:hypothetical protein
MVRIVYDNESSRQNDELGWVKHEFVLAKSLLLLFFLFGPRRSNASTQLL